MQKKPKTLKRRFRRWKRRMIRRHPWMETMFTILEAALGFVVVLAVVGGILLAVWPRGGKDVPSEEVAAEPTQVVFNVLEAASATDSPGDVLFAEEEAGQEAAEGFVEVADTLSAYPETMSPKILSDQYDLLNRPRPSL